MVLRRTNMVRALAIKDFPDYYICDNGDVYSRKRGRFQKLVPIKNPKNGYMAINVCAKGQRRFLTIHRLVAQAFIPNPDNKCDVNHKNGNKSDNCVENLEWNTRSENMKHSFNVLKQKPTWLGKFGDKHPNSKIIQQIKDGKVIGEFYGSGEASRKTGINKNQILRCCEKRKWVKTAGGYKWKYKD